MGATSRERRASLSPDHCEIPGCEWAYAIQRHRIKPGRNGGKYRKGNVISCCPNHHWLADREEKGFEPSVLLAIVDARTPNRKETE